MLATQVDAAVYFAVQPTTQPASHSFIHSYNQLITQSVIHSPNQSCPVGLLPREGRTERHCCTTRGNGLVGAWRSTAHTEAALCLAAANVVPATCVPPSGALVGGREEEYRSLRGGEWPLRREDLKEGLPIHVRVVRVEDHVGCRRAWHPGRHLT